MLTVPVRRDIEVDPDVVWDLLVDTSRWPEWGPSIDAVDITGSRLDARSNGRVRTPLGVWVPFRVSDFIEGRSWAWTVAGVPATTHLVEATPQGCCATFGVPLLAAAYAPVCAVALRRIERLALAEVRR
jgi:uncharacterized protein YndB with AHSA1/START domain